MPALRKLSAGDKIVDGTLTHTVNLLRLAAGQRREVLAMLEELEADLVAQVLRGGKTAWSNTRLQTLLRHTRDVIKTAYGKIEKQQAGMRLRVVANEAKKTVKVLNDAIGVSVANVGMTLEQLEAVASKVMLFGRFPREFWEEQGKTLQNRFAAQMRLGILQGEGVDKLVARVRGTKARGYTDGVMQVSRSNAEALVRSSVITTANTATMATIMANADIVKAIEWIATLDNRTTPICIGLDGKQWSIPELQPIGHNKAFPGATAHWGCRSRQVAVTKSWAELAGPKAKLKDFDTGKKGNLDRLLQAKLVESGMNPDRAKTAAMNQRASIDGPTQLKTFEQWLGAKSDAEQNSLLGPGRAALWREGKVSLSQMTDQNNRPLTLRELETMVAKNQNTPPRREGENGVSLGERLLLQESMRRAIDDNKVVTHYVSETGQKITTPGTTLTAGQIEEIAAFKKLTVLQGALAAGDVWGPAQINLFGKLRNFARAVLVSPTGRLATLEATGDYFGKADAAEVTRIMETLSTLTAEQRVGRAVRKNGKLKFRMSETGAIEL